MIKTILLSAVLLATAPAASADDSEDLLLQSRLEAHITFLADDLLRGRQPGTPGYDIAAAYVASQFRQMGLQPAGDGGSYFQAVPLRSARLTEGSAVMTLQQDDITTEFTFADQFFTGPSLSYLDSSLEAEMVFAGYGIRAPLLKYDDYEGLDVEGKVVVVMAGMPLDFPREEGAHFSNRREIARNAIERGAIGMLRIFTPRSEQRFEWSKLLTMIGMPSMSWLDGEGRVFPDYSQLQGGALVHFDAAGALFEGSGHELQDLI